MGHEDDRRHRPTAPTPSTRATRASSSASSTPGIDGTHPDIKPNFNKSLSRNFTVDIPDIDGPCEVKSCKDPANVDDDGHGTHVAGTVAAAINGRGIAGVAPGVTLVNLRAGQDSGFFFLGPTVDALTYAGRHGIDVVNMSFYTDPWLYNCADNPADSPDAQAEQRTIIAATQRAVSFARRNGVTLISAEGNEHTDLGQPDVRCDQPRLRGRAGPVNQAYPRTVDNSCLNVPTESDGVDLRQRHRAERQEGRLLQLRHRADGLRGAGWVLPRLLRDPASTGSTRT